MNMATLKENYYSPTPKKYRKIGDTILMITTGLQPILAGAPMPEGIKVWVMVAISILGLIGKGITNLYTEEDEPVKN